VDQTIEDFLKEHDHPLLVVWYDQNLSEILALLRRNNEQMAIVREVIPPATGENSTNHSYRLCGVITLEDIAEEIVGAKIAEQSLTNHEIHLIYESILKNIPNIFSYKWNYIAWNYWK
jgi:CBS domain containing-hemolysin-like protein